MRRGEPMSRRMIVAAGALILAATLCGSPAWADWGCAAISLNGKSKQRNYGFATRNEARTDALVNCRTLGNGECRLLNCEPHVDTKERALELWPVTPGNKLRCSEGASC